MGNSGIQRNYPVYALVLMGLTLSTLVAIRLGEIGVTYGLTEPGLISITLTQAPLLAAVFWIGVQLNRSQWSLDAQKRVLMWTGAGLLGFISVNLLIMTQFPAIDGISVFAWVTWAATVGSTAGAITGYFEGKSIMRAKAEARQATRAEEAEAREELLDYLNSLLRHEVLNSANIIQGYTELIKETEDVSATCCESLTVIDNQARELSSITEDVRFLLTASKSETEFTPVNLHTTIEREMQKLNDRFADCETETDIPTDVAIPGDALFRRIFTNILSNAIEHNTTNRTPHVSATATTTPDCVEIKITDNGPGLCSEYRDAVFQPKTEGSPDHGLGLVIVKTLTRRYNGSIELTDTGPDGTTFTLTFPRTSTNTDNGDRDSGPEELRKDNDRGPVSGISQPTNQRIPTSSD